MKLKKEIEVWKEYLRFRKCIDDPTAIYLIYQMGFLEGTAPIRPNVPVEEKKQCPGVEECTGKRVLGCGTWCSAYPPPSIT